jgi:hypothetical protein
MKRIKKLYLEEVELILENLQAGGVMSVTRDNSKAFTFTLTFDSEEEKSRMEDLLFFNSMDFDAEDRHGASGRYHDDEDAEYESLKK